MDFFLFTERKLLSDKLDSRSFTFFRSHTEVKAILVVLRSTNGVRTTWTAFIVRIALEITKKSDLWTAAASWTVRMKYFNNIPLRIMNWHTKSSLEFQFSAFLKLWCDIWIVAVQYSFRAVDNIWVLLTVPNIISEFESEKLYRGQNGPFRNNSKSQPLR